MARDRPLLAAAIGTGVFIAAVCLFALVGTASGGVPLPVEKPRPPLAVEIETSHPPLPAHIEVPQPRTVLLEQHSRSEHLESHPRSEHLHDHEPVCEPIDVLPELARYDCLIRKALQLENAGPITPENIKAEIEVESSGRMDAVSSAGALCAMQLLPDTFRSMLPRGDITDPWDCIRAGVKYRGWCARFWHKGLRPEDDRWGPLSELCYNAGPGGGLNAQARCGGYTSDDILPCAPLESRNYVVRIRGLEEGRPRGWWLQ